MFTQAKIQGAFEQFSTKSFFLRAFQVPLEVQKLDSRAFQGLQGVARTLLEALIFF